MKHTILTAVLLALAPALPASAQLVSSGDATIRNQLCVGSDCPDDPTASFLDADAGSVMLFDDRTRIDFVDSSAISGEFPDLDWALIANDTTSFVNGGLNRFILRDMTNGTEPFVIQGGAPSTSFWIDAAGEIGLGTSLPQDNLHIVGSTPSIRFDDNSGRGQVWELLANALGFRVIDLGTGNTPFRLEANAPTDALRIQGTTGNVGIGISSAEAPLHVRRNNGAARIFVEELGGTPGARELLLLKNNGGSYFTLRNSNSGRDWFFTHEHNPQGRLIITSSTNPSKGMFFSDTGNLQIGGVLTENSDRNAKMEIEPVDPAEVLSKVAALPVAEWSYTDVAGVRHMGPMAQDFHALFGLGESEMGLSTLDTSGVALAAIQALAMKNSALETALAEQTAALLDRIEALEAELARR